MAEWQGVMKALDEARKFNLHGYRFAHLLSWDERGLSLGFPSDEYDLWAGPERETELKDFLRARYEQAIAVSVRPLDPTEQNAARAHRSVEALDRERAAELDRKKRQEVLGNRAYAMLKERFNPVNVEINTDV